MSEIDMCLRRAAEERELANSVKSSESRDEHVMRAERMLDRAWSLNEDDDERPPMEIGFWQ